MAPVLITKQVLMSSKAPMPPIKVIFNENASNNYLLVYIFVADFIKIKFGISSRHLVRLICCNLTTC